MTSVQEIFKKCEYWMRLVICINIHIKEALINVVHNYINDPLVTPIPSDPAALYAFLRTNKRKIQKSPSHQQSILLPTNSQSVDSSSFDISIIRFLIQTFCGIANARGDWKEPDQNDQTLCAHVYRAAKLRNSFAHNNDIKGLNATDFETKWEQLDNILKGLKYNVNLEPFKTEPFDLVKYEKHVLLEAFVDHLCSYKEEYSKEPSQDDYILRRFHVDRNEDNIVTESDSESTSKDNDEKDILTDSDLESLIKENDRLIIYGEAGLGKTSTAKRLKNEWFNKNILNGHHLIYYDSKRMGKLVKVKSFAAPLYFSELGDYLREKGRTEDDLSIYECVKTTIDNLIIIIDGIDEFSVREVGSRKFIDKLEKKVKNNEEITAAETISAIYHGFFFPFSKVVLLGRIGEFDLLKKVQVGKNAGIFNRRNIDLELLKFNDTNIKDFTCLKICKLPNRKNICIDSCQGIYKEIKNIELCEIPTDLNSLLEFHRKHPNINIRKITRTNLIIATLLNRLINHINQENYLKNTFTTFRKINEHEDLSNYLKCIRKLGELSFNTLLEDNIIVQVEEKQGQFIYKEISIERETLEELDLFYVRDLDFYSILEPRHTINIEFLSACYLFLFSHPEKWDSILKLNKDRQLVIISFIAGLHADDNLTQDFVENVFRPSSYSLEQFFSWLYDVENVHESLPDGGYGYHCWFGLMETQKISPSFFLLDYISHEMEIPPTFIPKSIVCYSGVVPPLEWYNMKYFKHNFLTKFSDNLNIELFLNRYPQYDFIIKGDIAIRNNDDFNLFNTFCNNNRMTFSIHALYIHTSLNTTFSCNFNVDKIIITDDCDSPTINMIFKAVLSNSQPDINCKELYIEQFNRLFEVSRTRVTRCELDCLLL